GGADLRAARIERYFISEPEKKAAPLEGRRLSVHGPPNFTKAESFGRAFPAEIVSRRGKSKRRAVSKTAYVSRTWFLAW
ncbi:MAG: hypothetical protein ACLPL5_13630, partial [Stellaceae bacterium]